jgi:hypothetical protein
MEASQVSIERWTNKWKVAYSYNGLLFSLEKIGDSGVCDNMGKYQGHYTKWNKLLTKRQMLYDAP